MKEYKNFYETMDEARMRLFGTMVCHDGEPYNVQYLSDKGDDVFKLYLMPVGRDLDVADYSFPNLDAIRLTMGADKVEPFFDEWKEQHPRSAVIKVPINSPGFNKFRPFPLGMVNHDAKVYYAERQPQRKTEQGLVQSAIDVKQVSIGTTEVRRTSSYRPEILVNIYTNDFACTVRGEYPSPYDCLYNLLDNEIVNQGAAFSRQFALIRGPIGLIFLAYKTDIVGVLPFDNFGRLTIGRDYLHLRELISELGIFHNIGIQK